MRLFLLLISLITSTFLLKAQLPNYIPILVGDKYGFCDSNKNMLIEPQYDKVDFWHDSQMNIEKNKELYRINLTTGKITKGVYEQPAFGFEIKKDSIYIISNRKNTTLFSVPVNKSNPKQIGLEVVDTANQIFFLNYYQKNKYKKTDVVSKKGILLTFTRLPLHQYPVWKKFFVAKEDSLYSLYKITPNGITKVSKYNYVFISPPNESGILKAVSDTPFYNHIETVYYRKNKFKTIHYKQYTWLNHIDTMGNEILRVPDIISGNKHEQFYNYITRRPILKADSTENFLVYNEKQIIFKDTLTNEWQKVEIPTYYSEAWKSNPYPMPSLHQRIGNNLIIYRSINSLISNRYFFQLVNTKGKQLLPKTYMELRKYNDSMLYFNDSISTGYITTTGKEIFKVNRFIDSMTYSAYYDANKIIWVNGYHKSGDTTKHIALLYKWDENGLSEIDYEAFQKKTKRETDSLLAMQQAQNTYWILRDKKVRIAYNEKTEQYDVLCDEKLINPHMQIVDVYNYDDVLFLMKSKSGHTWIYDNNGKVVYNTDKGYEYDFSREVSGKTNHFIITIKNEKSNKFIANIHWPGFSVKPHYTELPIQRFLDSFTVVNTNRHDYRKPDRYGLYNQYGNLIIHPYFSKFDYLKLSGATNKYFFYVDNNTRKPGLLYNSEGNIIFDNIVYADFYKHNYYNNSPRNIFEIFLKEQKKIKKIFVDKYGTIYHKNAVIKQN